MIPNSEQKYTMDKVHNGRWENEWENTGYVPEQRIKNVISWKQD